MQMDCVSVGQSHTQDVKSVLWHPTRELLVSCSYDDTMKVWQDDDDDWVCTETLCGHSSTVWDASFEPKAGAHLASVGEDHALLLWHFTNPNALPAPGDEISRFQLLASDKTTHTRSIYSVDWSSTGPYIATGCADDAVRVFLASTSDSEPSSTTSSSPLALLTTATKAHDNDVNCVKWHPSQNVLASCGDDGLVKLWAFMP